jgi:uncharacterized protein with HEPN domain
MSKQPKEYLSHILDEINYLLNSSENLTLEELMYNDTLQRSFTRSIEIIGEATKKLTDVDWKSMAAMRDKLIHDYFGVDYEIVWDVVKNKIPALKPQIEEILKELVE